MFIFTNILPVIYENRNVFTLRTFWFTKLYSIRAEISRFEKVTSPYNFCVSWYNVMPAVKIDLPWMIYHWSFKWRNFIVQFIIRKLIHFNFISCWSVNRFVLQSYFKLGRSVIIHLNVLMHHNLDLIFEAIGVLQAVCLNEVKKMWVLTPQISCGKWL